MPSPVSELARGRRLIDLNPIKDALGNFEEFVSVANGVDGETIGRTLDRVLLHLRAEVPRGGSPGGVD